MVDNYPGFADGIEGLRLAEQLQNKAERFGTKIEFGQIDKISVNTDGTKTLLVDGMTEVKANTVLR